MDSSNFDHGPNSGPHADGQDAIPDTLPYPQHAGAAYPPHEAVPPPPSVPAPESALVHSSGGLHTIRTAAAYLGVDPDALRAECREATSDGSEVADLGGGIYAFKSGAYWRVRFPWWQRRGRRG